MIQNRSHRFLRLRSASLTNAFARVLLLLAIALAFALLQITPPTWFAGSSFTACALIFFAREPRWRARFAAGALGLCIFAVYALAHEGLRSWPTMLAYGIGTASFCVAAFTAIAADDREFRPRFQTALVVSILIVSLYVDVPVLLTITARSPLTFDSILTRADQSLGGNASFLVGQFLRSHPVLRATSRIAYYGLPVGIMIAAALRWRKFGRSDATSIPAAVALGAVMVPLFYMMVPAAGPVFRWGARFPFDPPTGAEIAMAPSPLNMSGVLNAMPSLHFAYALLVLWGTWTLGVAARTFGVAFAILTLLSTLGLGEHYVVDLIVAVPLAIMLELAVRRPSGWEYGVAACALLTLGWLLGLRLAPSTWTSRGVAWSAVAVTCFTIAAVVWRIRSREAGGVAAPAIDSLNGLTSTIGSVRL
jgi:PAP2 superfamily